MDTLHSLVESNSLKPIASPLDSLPGVFLYTELLTHTNKSSQHPEYLRQAALEVINNIPIEATLIYTDAVADLDNMRPQAQNYFEGPPPKKTLLIIKM
ncbi:hypothetical protein AVEN_6546-1 [Araneus ventricosus]|uniref:Uncharacterized protein n=1 Tax=Araneus ventricosus TaxID=182803 RepID=A0A4Y2KZ56_ARAVE|nr:hypothetical protein AVEN_6546-1 [Araneus ventricosus]